MRTEETIRFIDNGNSTTIVLLGEFNNVKLSNENIQIIIDQSAAVKIEVISDGNVIFEVKTNKLIDGFETFKNNFNKYRFGLVQVGENGAMFNVFKKNVLFSSQ